MKINKDYLEIIKAAKAGGQIVKKYFGKNLKITGKTIPADFKTRADMESEEAILKIIKKKFPKYNIIAEENGKLENGSEYTFAIDPLDGTNNFVLGIPYFSVSIALLKGDEIIFGVVYNPILDNMYFAEKGRGAYLNNKRIFVNKESDLKNSSVPVVFGFKYQDKYERDITKELYLKRTKRVLFNWSFALDAGFLASGKYEAIYVKDINLYDFAAGKLIAREAGALITDEQGNPEKNDKNEAFLISNGTKIHKEILEILKK